MASTLLTLRNRVLYELNDNQNAVTATGDRYKTPQLNSIINQVIKFYGNMLNSNYQGYLSVDLPLSILANVSRYNLGSVFRSPIYQIRRQIDEVIYYMEPFTPYNAVLSTVAVPNAGWVPTFWLEGTYINFSYPPQADEVNACTIKYQKKLTELVSDVSELDDELYDAEDCIVLRATIRALKSKDVSGALKNVAGWEKELAEAERVFMMQVGNRYVKPDRPIPTSYSDNYSVY